METVVYILKVVAAVGAAMALGNWFLSEVKALKAKGEPIYKAYFTLPGILVIIAVLIPVVLNLWLG